MVKIPPLKLDDKWIRSQRNEKNKVDPQKPYAFLIEKEHTSSNLIEDVATVFLTNRECPFNCLMCDLWKNTTDFTVTYGAIPKQLEWILSHLCRLLVSFIYLLVSVSYLIRHILNEPSTGPL